MKANAEAAKRRLTKLNEEYALRRKVAQIAKDHPQPKGESFGEAFNRLMKENPLAA